jgi:hypothetical protein
VDCCLVYDRGRMVFCVFVIFCFLSIVVGGGV